MEKYQKQLWILLVFLWIVFIIWEFNILALPQHLLDAITRYDLMLFPVLIVFTCYVAYPHFKTEKARKESKKNNL